MHDFFILSLLLVVLQLLVPPQGNAEVLPAAEPTHHVLVAHFLRDPNGQPVDVARGRTDLEHRFVLRQHYSELLATTKKRVFEGGAHLLLDQCSAVGGMAPHQQTAIYRRSH